MIVSRIFLIAASSMVSCASRLKYIPQLLSVPQTMTGPTLSQALLVHTRVNLLHPQMKVASPSGDDSSQLWMWSNASLAVGSPMGLAYKGADIRISHQVFPPAAIYGIDTKHLLFNWASSLIDLLEKKSKAPAKPLWLARYARVTGSTNTSKTLTFLQDDRHMVLDQMLYVGEGMTEVFLQPDTPRGIAKLLRFGHEHLTKLWRTRRQVEVVGLILRPTGWGGFVRASDARVQALGVFSREKLKDDRKGSIRKKVEEQYGKGPRLWWEQLPPPGRAKKNMDVFAIEGVVDAPGLTERSARVLLSKIAKYAYEEQRIVVVPQRALFSSEGIDLTEYYVRLGFEKVEMKGKGRLHELVYTGASSPDVEEARLDMRVERRQIMIGMDIWRDI